MLPVAPRSQLWPENGVWEGYWEFPPEPGGKLCTAGWTLGRHSKHTSLWLNYTISAWLWRETSLFGLVFQLPSLLWGENNLCYVFRTQRPIVQVTRCLLALTRRDPLWYRGKGSLSLLWDLTSKENGFFKYYDNFKKQQKFKIIYFKNDSKAWLLLC